MVMNLCPSFGGKIILCQETDDELLSPVVHHAVTSLTLSKQGILHGYVSQAMGDATRCSVRRAKGGCGCFAVLAQGATCTFIVGSVSNW